jgi:predicted secreted protein
VSANPSRGLRVSITDTSGQTVGGYHKSHALLVGVSDYTAGWPDLESIPAELALVEKTLISKGFTVRKVVNPTSRELKNAYQNFIDEHGYEKESRLLFFYAGHGFTRANGRKGYLVPADAPNPEKDEVGFLRKSLDMNRILSWSREMESKHALFLFDSCFSGAIFKQRDLPKQPAHISRLTAEPVRQFITAGAAGETVPANSVFTPVFVDALKYGLGDLNKDGYVSGTELGLYLQEKVPQHTSQTPQYGKIKDYNLSRGDFIFLAKAAPTAAPPVAEKIKGSLQISTNPPGATIFVDGANRGQGPISVDGLSDRAIVRASLNGYKGAEERVRIRPGKTQKLVLTLRQEVVHASFAVQSNPSGAKWYLDGDYMGRTPDRASRIRPGNHRIKIVQDGYGEWTQNLSLSVGQNTPVVAQLKRLLARSIPAPALPSPPAMISIPTGNEDWKQVYRKLQNGFARYQTPSLVIKAPDVAENGAVVPISVTQDGGRTGQFYVFVTRNPSPFAASFRYHKNLAQYFVSTRIKLAQTGEIIVAFVDQDGRLFANRKQVRVTIGGLSDRSLGKPVIGNSARAIRMRASVRGGQGTIKTLISAHSAKNGYIRQLEFVADASPVVTATLTRYVSQNPYFGFYFPGSAGDLTINIMATDGTSASSRTVNRYARR